MKNLKMMFLIALAVLLPHFSNSAVPDLKKADLLNKLGDAEEVMEVEDEEMLEDVEDMDAIPPAEPRQVTQGPLVVLAAEKTAIIQDGIDSFARGEPLFPGPIDEPIELPDPLRDVSKAAGGLVNAGAKLTHGAIKLQSKLVAPIIKLGAKVTAPIVKVKAKLAAPLVFAGTSITKPLAKGAIKLAAPALKVGQLAAKGISPIGKPIADGLADAFSPITIATQPLAKAVKPLEVAAQSGFGNLEVQEAIDSVTIQEDVNNFAEDAGLLVEETLLLGNAGVRLAQQTALNAVADVRNVLNINGKVGGGVKNLNRRRREVENYQESLISGSGGQSDQIDTPIVEEINDDNVVSDGVVYAM